MLDDLMLGSHPLLPVQNTGGICCPLPDTRGRNGPVQASQAAESENVRLHASCRPQRLDNMDGQRRYSGSCRHSRSSIMHKSLRSMRSMRSMEPTVRCMLTDDEMSRANFTACERCGQRGGARGSDGPPPRIQRKLDEQSQFP